MQGSPIRFELEDLSPVEKRLKIEVAREHVQGKLDEAYRKATREVNLRGFRKGKAPRDLLERMFGKQISHNVARDLMEEGITLAAQQLPNLRMANTPVVDEMPEARRGQPLHFTARLEVWPIIEARDYDGIEVTRQPIDVADEDVSKELEHRRRAHVENDPIGDEERAARAAQQGDMLRISIHGALGSFPVNAEDVEIDVGEEEPVDLPGLARALIGVPLNAVDHEIAIKVPDEPRPGVRPEVRGKEGTFKVTVKAAYRRRLPELDDEFAKDTGEAETLDELKTKIREQLRKEGEERAQRELRLEVLDEAVRRNPVMMPPGLLARVMEANQDEVRRHRAMKAFETGKPLEEIDEASARDELRAEFVRQFCREMVLTAVADKEKIEVTPAEVEKRLAETAKAEDKSVARVRAELQRNDPDLNGFKNQLRNEKALDLLASRANIKEASSQ